MPISIAHTDGSLRKTNKSVLLGELQHKAEAQPKLSLPPIGMSSARITDAMAMIQIMKAAGVAIFGVINFFNRHEWVYKSRCCV